MSNVTIPNLPSVTSLSGSSQLQVVQNGTSYRATAQQIANLNANGGTVTSVTAQSPLSGGTITTTGTIGLNNNGVTNDYLAQMAAYTIKGNNTAGSAQPQDLTAAQVRSLIGAGTISSLTAGTGLTTLSTNPLTTSGTILIDVTGVTSGTYGTATAVPQITINAQGQITSASRVNILIPTSQITGLGTMATQNANAVAITGGTINQTSIGATTASTGSFTNLTATGTVSIGTISSGTWQGTPIAVAYGGTGATSASAARTNLGAAASGANSDITSLSGLTTPLSETQGGTGYGSYTTGDILYASSSTTLARLNDVATGNALISGGVGVAPSYGKIGLTTHVSGTLPVANGGTGATTLTGYLVGNGTSAFTAVSTIPNAGLTNSSITIGSTAISLGASTSTLAGLTTVTVTQDPTASLQLSTKQYVDNQVATVSNTTFHTASAAATTANLTATYNNGTAGVGATLTNSGAQAAFAVDGYTASLSDRILVKDMTTAAYNGIYTVTTVGSGSTNWVLTRSTDFNTVGTGPNYIETGASTFVSGGTTWGSTSWVMNTTGTITVGSTALVWVQTSSSGNITVSAPITKTGNTIGLGTVGVANGGTGLTTLTAYGLLYAASTSSVGQISPSTTGYPLLSTGASTAPAFGQLALGGAGVTGTLGVTNGGTGTATAFTTGSVVFAGASGVYSQNNTKFFWDNTNNRLGINTATPQTQLTVVSNTQTTTPTGSLPAGTDLYIVGANAANTRITQDAYGTGAYGVFTARQARGTAASPTASQSGDFLAQFTARGYGATGFGTASTGYIAFSAAENFTDTAQGTYAGIYTTPTGSNSIAEAFRFGPAGQLGIGGATYGTSGQFLTSGGASAAPSWTTVTLATLGGVVPVASGGTNITSYTVGDLLYASASTTLSKLADVATGSVLVSGGVGVAPAWSNSPTVTALTTGSVSNSGNETFTGTGARILGDFTNATITNRLAFQTSTTNSTTGIYALPSGTSTAASWQATNAADPTNASKILIATNGSTDVQLVSGINGTGTYLPLTFYTSGAEKMRLDTSGNLGIGTTSPGAKLEVNGTIKLTPTLNGGLQINQSGGTQTAYIGPSGFGGFALGTQTADNVILFTNNSERMRIDTSGNVGIGTTSPGYRLDVSGSTRFKTTTNQNLNVITSQVLSGGTRLDSINDAGSANIPLEFGGSQFAWIASGAERMRIDSSGNVGIGTSSPNGLLDVTSNTNAPARYYFRNTNSGSSAYTIIELGTDNANNRGELIATSSTNSSAFGSNSIVLQNTGTAPVILATANTERMRIDGSGNVGIGTTSPQVTLGVTKNSGTYSADTSFDVAWFGNGTSAGGAGVHIVSATNGKSELGFSNSSTRNAGLLGYNMSSNYMYFLTSSTERMRIDSSGNLLVGTTTANGLLTVNGLGYFNGLRSGVTNADALIAYNFDGGGRAVCIAASSTGTQGILQFTNNAVSAQWTSLVGTNGLLTCNSAFTATGNITAFSDARLKKDVSTIDNALDLVGKMRGVRYTRVENDEKGIGVIAQEMQAVLPEVVMEGENLSVAYGNIVGVLIEAIKELRAEVADLRGKLQ